VELGGYDIGLVFGRLYKSSAVAEMGDRGHSRHARKGELGPCLTQCGLG